MEGGNAEGERSWRGRGDGCCVLGSKEVRMELMKRDLS